MRLTWLDVFTATPYQGNGLAVVHDADDLDDATMLAIARETRLSETTFVQRGGEGADYVNRIFTGLREIRFAGHPSLGTAVAVARAAGRDEARYVQRTRAGLQPIDVHRREGEVWRASMLQEAAEFGPRPDMAETLAAVGLQLADGHPDWAPEIVSTGVPQVLVPVPDRATLRRCRPDLPRLRASIAAAGAVVVYVFCVDGAEGTVYARSFLEDPGGLIEDPATGAAAGPVCAFLHRHAGTASVSIVQGVEMGRPSRLDAELEEARVRVGGEVVVVLDGQLV